MKIQVDDKGFTFGDHRFFFDLYYFDNDEWQAPTSADTFNMMLLKWAGVLEGFNDPTSPVFLPFAPYDESIECLRATYWENDKLTFSWVEIGAAGWDVDLTDIQAFSTKAYTLYRESPEFGECYKNEVISALISAEIINGL